MPTPESVARDARIREWIVANSTDLIQKSPLGVTLGLLASGLRNLKHPDIKDLTEEGFYYRCHRVLAELVSQGVIRKSGKQYFYVEPKDRVIHGLEHLIDHAFPGTKLQAKDLNSLRAALEGLEVAHAAKRKPRGKKPGSAVE